MAVVRLSLTALMLATATYCTHLLDQYEDGSDRTLGHRGKATDQAFDVHRPFVNGNSLNKLQTGDKQIVPPEDRVDFPHSLFELDEDKRRKVLRKRAVEEIKRKRRAFSEKEWNGRLVQAPYIPSFTVWQAPIYQLSRPYFIPVWGSHGRTPIYFPPQSLFVNSYSPSASINHGYLPPKGYLPPDTRATTIGYDNDDDATMTIKDRAQEEDPPVWGTEPIATTAASAKKPTRRTRRPGQTTTHPPLVHRSENSTSSNANNLSPARPERLPGNSAQTIDTPSVGLQTPNNRPQGGRQQPSRCVWAIISCCSAGSLDVSYSCFEQLGCPGAFWGSSPCNSDFAKSALELAMKYYN